MERFLCIHCHFYQPPRENPWLEAVELQDSAYPYHDWNERITAECYGPNGASRVLAGDGKIIRITNNYERISFNFGPTLLSWMEDNAQSVYQEILEADRVSQKRCSGHGNALAQAYNHMILPLANRADRYSQVLWGIRDFEHRFGRSPEGMWLPEAAVDTETLEILSDLGIRFTILAPRQAGRVKKIGGRTWKDVQGQIDPSRAYRMKLPSKRHIDLFFYDGPISQAVAFEGLLNNGVTFANRLLSGFSDARTWPQLMHISTDGETYGHHHRFGEMALAFALEYVETSKAAQITNYGEFLEKFPPTHEVQIVENTSWSCSHGVERWRNDCGCNTGGHAGWNQQWRAPLRQALDWLRDQLAPMYEQKAGALLRDPWRARDEYISVMLDRSPASLNRFLVEHVRVDQMPRVVGGDETPLSKNDEITILKLLELQRHLMLMYTSCGWFFDELSGLETVQVIMYAGRAVQLAQEVFGDHIEQGFLEKLALAHSNLAEQGTGADIYQRWVKPAAIDLVKVGAHYVISSLFERYGEKTSVYCYTVEREDYRLLESGRTRLALGRANICSRITRECADVTFGALHFGDHSLNSGVRPFQDRQAYDGLVEESTKAFLSADLPQTLRVLDRQFEGVTYSLKSLFRDEQRKILGIIMDATLAGISSSLRQIYEEHAPLMRFLSELNTPMPRVLHMTAEFVVNSSLRRAFEEQDLDLDRVRTLLDVATRERISLEGPGLSYVLKRTLEQTMKVLSAEPTLERLEKIERSIDLVRSLPFEVSLWKVQNTYWQMLEDVRPSFQAQNDEESAVWIERFDRLGEKLGIRIPAPEPLPEPAPAPATAPTAA
jgi:alpha-amylase/alpha-mannosidase (GH57 family)